MGDPYIGQIDAFAVYCPDLDASLLVPIADIAPKHVAVLRVDAPASQQRIGIRWAHPYALVRGNSTHGTAPVAMERKTRFELATPYLASRCATAAPLPQKAS